MLQSCTSCTRVVSQTRKVYSILTNMSCKTLLTLTILTTLGCKTDGKLIMKPRNTDIKVNQSTYLNCSTDFGSTDIFWFHGTKYVYTGIAILEPYHERFTIDKNEWNGTYIYNLIIHAVQPGDAGEYICAEDEGFGEKYSVQLVVLEYGATCRSNRELDEVIGQNSCNIEPDKVELECSVTYHGYIPPQMEWRKVGENRSMSHGVSDVTSRNHFVSTLKFEGDIALNNSSYVCETRRTTREPNKCISKVTKILYVFSGNYTANTSLGYEINCFANSSQSCTYKWKWFSGEDSVTMSNSQTLISTRVGLHRCEATCVLRNISCTVTVMFAEVLSTAPGTDKLFALLTLLVVPVICIGILMFWIIKRRPTDSHINTSVPLNPVAEIGLANDRYRRIPEPILCKQPVHYFHKAISGLTVLDDELFILLNSINCIEVYDLTAFCLLRTLEIPGLRYPIDLASDAMHRIIYILGTCKSRFNKIVTIDRNGMVLNEKSVDDKCGGLSITNDSEMLVAVWFGKPQILRRKIEEDQFRTIELPSDFFHPWHAIKLTNGQFLVSHGHRHSKHRVCMVSELGDITIEYGGKCGSQTGELNSPYDLAVDSSGYILVADVDNSRILLFDPDLKFIRELISPAVDNRFDLRKPLRMYFDEPKGRLYIADNVFDIDRNCWKNGRFWVFDVMKEKYSSAPVPQIPNRDHNDDDDDDNNTAAAGGSEDEVDDNTDALMMTVSN